MEEFGGNVKMHTIENLKISLEKKPELREHLFTRGFLLTDDESVDFEKFPFYSQWNVKQFGKYKVCTHSKLKLHYCEKNENYFIIFGHAYNPFTMQSKEEDILEEIAGYYGKTEFQEKIDEITGIFTFCVISEDKVEFEVDPSGMQSTCAGIVKEKFYLSSHSQLIGDICNLKKTDLVKELINYKWYYRVMGPYLPGNMTPFEELKRVVPDIAYTYENKKIAHKRFFPIKELTQCETQDEYDRTIIEGAEILKNNMRLVIEKWKKPYISLTGGIDSNTTFAAANGMYDAVKAFSYISAEKETIDADAAKKIANEFGVEHIIYHIPTNKENLKNYEEIVQIIDHNNGYVAKGKENEYRKRVYLVEHLDCDVEVKSWVSETIRGYWYKHYGRTSMPRLSAKLYRNLYKIFILNRQLAWKIDKVFEKYIDQFEYNKIPLQYPIADMHYNEVTWGSWGGLNISEMKIYSDITIIYNNRKFLNLMFKIPLKMRIEDKHHIALKKVLNERLWNMNIRVVNMHETKMRAALLNVIFTINSILPF